MLRRDLFAALACLAVASCTADATDRGEVEAPPGVVRIVGSACGLDRSGSGWVAEHQKVVTAAHVVAGEPHPRVFPGGHGKGHRAMVVAFDPRNDLAVLDVPGLDVLPLPMADPVPDSLVDVLGYPHGGKFTKTASRVRYMQTRKLDDTYGVPRERRFVWMDGRTEPGYSGGPVVDGRGRVVVTHQGRLQTGGLYGVPTATVRDALSVARVPGAVGPCINR